MAGYKRHFTKKEDSFILKNDGVMMDKDIAKALKRTTSSITSRKCRLKQKLVEEDKLIDESRSIQNVFVRIKTGSGLVINATSAQELIDELKYHTTDKVIKFESYNSIIEMIKDDYMHNDLCMSELIRGNWMNKVDFEDIAILLHWAGEEDALHDFEIDEYLD